MLCLNIEFLSSKIFSRFDSPVEFDAQQSDHLMNKNSYQMRREQREEIGLMRRVQGCVT